MIEAAERIIRTFHSERLAEFQADDARVVWNSRHSQESRFAVLATVGDLTGATLLDVGCGLGDFSTFLRSRNVQFASYTGIDLNAEMVSAARTKYPSETFEVRDPADEPFAAESFDYVFESGIFNFAVPEWESIARQTMRAMFQACRKGIAMNFLSKLSGNENPEAHYSQPSEILSMIEDDLSAHFVLRHDYRTNDFTVFVYKGSYKA